jgi:predicted extracellular nuclease
MRDSSVDARFIDTKNRPTLAQTFEEKATSEKLTVSVNRLKFKGPLCDDSRVRGDVGRAL